MTRTFKTVAVSGYFDPLHVGHIDYLKNARMLGDKLIVILNNDSQRHNRMKVDNRKIILESIRYVDEVFVSIDSDQTVCDSLEFLAPNIFAKGAVPTESEIQTCADNEIEVVTNVGQQLYIQDILSEFCR